MGKKTGGGAATGLGVGLLAAAAMVASGGVATPLAAGLVAGTTTTGAAAGSRSDAGVAKRAAGAMSNDLNQLLKPKEKPVMPTVDNAAVRNAQRNKALSLATRTGRASTILTDQSNKLGG